MILPVSDIINTRFQSGGVNRPEGVMVSTTSNSKDESLHYYLKYYNIMRSH